MISRRLLRIKVLKALYAHLKSESCSLAVSEKNLVASIDKTYDLYFQMLSLIVELARHAEQRQQAAMQKRLPTAEDLNPNRKFVENSVIRIISESDYVNDYLASHKLSWNQYPELIKNLFNELEQTESYQKYMLSQERSFREDLALVTDFYTNGLEESEALEEALEEQSIMWNDDLGFALIMVTRTLSNMRASHQEVKVLPKFKSEDDLEYAKELFAKTALKFDKHQQLIEQFTRNWDVERIAYMDNLIMAIAVTELLSFPSIPVKVTLDEYIEIAKYYSSPGSSNFINGVLDKIVSTLNEEGKIDKLIAAHNVGRAVNPLSIEGQIEGGVVMSLGYSLTERYPLDHCKPTAKYGTLGLLRANQVPEIQPIIVEKDGLDVACGAIGIGEIVCVPTAAAVADAYYRYDGNFRTALPLANTPYTRK